MSKAAQIEALSAQISGLAKISEDAAPEKLQTICSQIKKLRCSKEESTRLFEKLQVSFTLFCNLHPGFLEVVEGQNLLLNYCKAFAQFRQNLLSNQQLKNLTALTVKIDFTKLSPAQLQNLAASFDKIGFGVASPFASPEAAQAFLQQGLSSLQRTKYKGEEWTKNAAHFLIHCRNLGLLTGSLLSENVQMLRATVADISAFIDCNEFNFAASDAQASLDILLYAKHSLKSQTLDLAIERVGLLVGEEKDDSSKTHLAIFRKIVKFLENKKGGDDEWKHLAQGDEDETKFTYSGAIEIEIESPYLTQNGSVLKRGDIVVRNLVSGEIILVIEVDGPTHFLTEEIKTGKTQARDKLAKKLLGENCVMAINTDSFSFFRGPQQHGKLKAELDFLVKIQKILQVELDKILQQPQAAAASAAGATKAEPKKVQALETKAAAAKAAVKIKTKAERKAELLTAFWEVLSGKSDDNIEEILRDPIFDDIAPNDIRHPESSEAALDFATKRLSAISDPKHKANYEDLVKTLWILGFNHEDKTLDLSFRFSENPVTKTEKKSSNFVRILRQAYRGNFHFVNEALQAEGLPSELTWKEDFSLFLLAKLCLKKSARGDSVSLELFREKPWFSELEERIFAEALENSDQEMAAISLSNHDADFFVKFFSQREDLLRKIYDLDFSMASQLEKYLEKPLDLFNKIVESLLADFDSWRKKDQILFARVVFASSSQAPEVLTYKAFFHFNGIGVKEDKDQARKLMAKAARTPSKNYTSNVFLISLYDKDNKPEEASSLIRSLLKDDVSGVYHHDFSSRVKSPEEKIFYLKKAAELKHPYSLGVRAVHYLTGRHGESKDIGKAISLLKEAIALGDVESITNLGMVYFQNNHPDLQGIEANKKAFELFLEAEQKKSATSAFNLAMCYREGLNGAVELDLEKSKKYFELSLKYDDEHSHADMARKNIAEIAEIQKQQSMLGVTPREASKLKISKDKEQPKN